MVYVVKFVYELWFCVIVFGVFVFEECYFGWEDVLVFGVNCFKEVMLFSILLSVSVGVVYDFVIVWILRNVRMFVFCNFNLLNYGE